MAQLQPVISRLLDSDPSVRWQTMRDLMDADTPVWEPERPKVETEGWGARLLSLADDDGQWAGAAFFPADWNFDNRPEEGQPWTATAHCLDLLREMGLDPTSPAARRMVDLLGANCRWEEGGQAFWDGEVEECINGRTLSSASYFGAGGSGIADRLCGQLQPDGGWNCDRSEGSSRSSFDSTINVLEGLAAFERATGGTDASIAARASGEEYLLSRKLFRRSSDQSVVKADYLLLTHPNRFRYDILRALDYFREAAALCRSPVSEEGPTGSRGRPDHRLAEAVELVAGRQTAHGRWVLEADIPGRRWFDVDAGVGQASPWITLRALRVLQWWREDPPS